MKIRSIYCRFGSERQNVDLEYNSKDKVFVVIIPEKFVVTKNKFIQHYRINCNKQYYAVHGETESEAIENFKKYQTSIEQVQRKSRKVICYEIEYFSKNNKPKDEDDARYYCGSHDERAFISVEYHICMEHNFNGEITFIEEGKSEDDDYRPGSSKQIIDWTQEREDFFKNLYSSMEQLIKRVDKFLGTPSKVLKSIDTNLKLLPKS